MSDIILHHYPPSPVSEKIRTVLGLKSLAWQSVEQNRLPERPDLFAMTGGYRRIPVMQCGADIYCDTQLIFRELERRHPDPSLHPTGSENLAFGLSRWIDGEFFELCVRAAFAPVADTLPPALLADRTRLYFGADGDMRREADDMPHTLAQLRPQLGWLDERLARGPFLSAETPAMANVLAWYVVWFIRARYVDADSFLAEFSHLAQWAERMAAIGHGRPSDITPSAALAIARDATSTTDEQADDHDPQGLSPGMPVSVIPLSRNDVETPVEGRVRALGRDVIAIERHHEACGEVVVHFPRVGYRVTVL